MGPLALDGASVRGSSLSLAMNQGTHRRFGDSSSSGGPSIASGVHGICLRVLNLEGPRMSRGVGRCPCPQPPSRPHTFLTPLLPLPSAPTHPPAPLHPVELLPSAIPCPPRPTPCSCGH